MRAINAINLRVFATLILFGLSACGQVEASQKTSDDQRQADSCKTGPCVADEDKRDRAMVDAALRKMSVAELIERQKANGDYYSRCPDSGYRLDESCKFDAAIAMLGSQQMANLRIKSTIEKCTEHDQTTINHCLSRVSEKVEAELNEKYAVALKDAITADVERKVECKDGGYACAGGMNHEKHLKAAQTAWVSYADNQCSYQTEGNVGGSGYGSFGMICWLKLAADRVDQLSPRE